MSGHIGAHDLRQILGALGSHLEAQQQAASIVVVGGAALSLRGWVGRTTRDVDVIATTSPSGEEWAEPRLGVELLRAAAVVARDFQLDADWLNSMVGHPWKAGLPDGIQQGVKWIRFGALRVGLVSRQSLITRKLFAAVDGAPGSVHVQDLRALGAVPDELIRAKEWVSQQDTSPGFPAMLEEVIRHVRARD